MLKGRCADPAGHFEDKPVEEVAHAVDAGPTLMDVEMMATKQKTHRRILLAVAAARAVIAGSGVGPGLLDALGGATDTVVAGAPEDTDGQPSVVFTGDDCVYSGPTEFNVGELVVITPVDVAEERKSMSSDR